MKSYLITDPKHYTNNPKEFEKTLTQIYKNYKPDFVCFRDKESFNYIELAKIFLKVSKKFNIQNILINSHIELAKELGYDGVHLTSTQLNQIEFAKSQNLYIVCSTHSLDEIKFCEKNGANAVTFSPIFTTPNKGKPKGVDELIKVLNQTNIKIFALGGIVTNEHLRELSKSGVYGFASIRYFLNS